MASGWSIIRGGTVALPYTPEVTDKEVSAQIDEEGTDAGSVSLFSKFKRASRFTIDGFVTAANNSTIMSTYLTPLEADIGKEVTITAPDSQYSGNWIMERFRYRRETPSEAPVGSVAPYFISVSFMQGGTHVIYVT